MSDFTLPVARYVLNDDVGMIVTHFQPSARIDPAAFSSFSITSRSRIVCCLSCRVWRRRRSEEAAERFNKWAATQSLSARQEGASEGVLFVALEQAHEELEDRPAGEVCFCFFQCSLPGNAGDARVRFLAGYRVHLRARADPRSGLRQPAPGPAAIRAGSRATIFRRE